jgi:hypothetical protein
VPPAQQRCDHRERQANQRQGARRDLHHRRGGDGERRGRRQGSEGKQGEGEAERPSRRVLAGRLQQRQAGRRRGAEPRERACGSGRAGAERLAQHQGRDQRARDHQQAGLLDGGREAEAKRLADRHESHVGGDAVDHDRRHDGEEDGKVKALDQQHDRDHGDRQEKGSEEHDGETLARFVLLSLLPDRGL